MAYNKNQEFINRLDQERKLDLEEDFRLLDQAFREYDIVGIFSHLRSIKRILIGTFKPNREKLILGWFKDLEVIKREIDMEKDDTTKNTLVLKFYNIAEKAYEEINRSNIEDNNFYFSSGDDYYTDGAMNDDDVVIVD